MKKQTKKGISMSGVRTFKTPRLTLKNQVAAIAKSQMNWNVSVEHDLINLFKQVHDVGESLNRLIDHVNREIGVAQDTPLHMGLKSDLQRVVLDYKCLSERFNTIESNFNGLTQGFSRLNDLCVKTLLDAPVPEAKLKPGCRYTITIQEDPQ